MTDAFENSMGQWLAQSRRAHRLHERRVRESPPQPIMRVDGRRLLVFSSDDYLGLANHPRVLDALRDGARKWGASAGGSPLISGYCSVHRQLEEEFADFVGRPRALLFSGDYLANMGMLGALPAPQDHVLLDRLNHAALVQAAKSSGAQLRHYRHRDPQSLQSELQHISPGRKLVATEGVFRLDGHLAPLAQIAQLCKANAALLAVDDAHGFGVAGDTGRGSCEAQGIEPDLLMVALDKALGTGGALVAGSDTLIEVMLQRASSYALPAALPGALAEGARVALRLLETEGWRREYVLALTERFKAGARRLRLPLLDSPTPIQPLVTGSGAAANRFGAALLKAGILVSTILPPDVPETQAGLRITLSSAHTTGHIDSLLSALADVWESLREATGQV